MKAKRIQTILDFLPRISFKSFTNKSVLAAIEEDLKESLESEIQLDSFLIYTMGLLDETIYILEDKFAIKTNLMDFPKQKEATEYLNGNTEVWKDEYYNINSAIEYAIGSISVINYIMDYYQGIGNKVNLNIVEDNSIRSILMDINKQGLEQDRSNLFDLHDFACCEYIHI